MVVHVQTGQEHLKLSVPFLSFMLQLWKTALQVQENDPNYYYNFEYERREKINNMGPIYQAVLLNYCNYI